MNYKEEIIKYLKNTEGNLQGEWTNDMTPFSMLAASAEEYLHENKNEGKIAALFIYQQLCIEMMKVLIIYSNFYEKLAVYPTKKEFKSFKENVSYSEVLNELKYKIEFKDKKKLIQKIKEINDLRNKFGHELFSQWWKHDIKTDLSNLYEKFENIFEIYGICQYDLIKKIKILKKKPEIEKLYK